MVNLYSTFILAYLFLNLACLACSLKNELATLVLCCAYGCRCACRRRFVRCVRVRQKLCHYMRYDDIVVHVPCCCCYWCCCCSCCCCWCCWQKGIVVFHTLDICVYMCCSNILRHSHRHWEHRMSVAPRRTYVSVASAVLLQARARARPCFIFGCRAGAAPNICAGFTILLRDALRIFSARCIVKRLRSRACAFTSRVSFLRPQQINCAPQPHTCTHARTFPLSVHNTQHTRSNHKKKCICCMWHAPV